MANLIDDRDLSRTELLSLLELTWKLKHEGWDAGLPLARKHVALVMAKPSLRTRVSFSVAIRDLGGSVIEVGSQNTKLGKGEHVREFAAVLGRMVDGIVARVFGHHELAELVEFSGVPVVNALSDLLHPCQAIADAFTVWEHARVAGAAHTDSAQAFFAQPHKLAYVGDGNNVAHSLMLTAANLGFMLALACPRSRQPDASILGDAQTRHPRGKAGIVLGDDPIRAVDGAQVVYTDTWVSMGQEHDHTSEQVAEIYAGFQVDSTLMGRANSGALFMHCLPAEPGREVTASVLRGAESVVLDQAENRLHTAKAVLIRRVFV